MSKCYLSSTPKSPFSRPGEAVDLGIVSVTFAVWSWVDVRRRSLAWWYVIPATCAVGICFAVPLYLLRREMARPPRR